MLFEAKKASANGRLDSQTQLALIKQILYDDEQLKSLLSKSDSTLRLVRDLLVTDEKHTSNQNQNDDNDDYDDVRSVTSVGNMVSLCIFKKIFLFYF